MGARKIEKVDSKWERDDERKEYLISVCKYQQLLEALSAMDGGTNGGWTLATTHPTKSPRFVHSKENSKGLLRENKFEPASSTSSPFN